VSNSRTNAGDEGKEGLHVASPLVLFCRKVGV